MNLMSSNGVRVNKYYDPLVTTMQTEFNSIIETYLRLSEPLNLTKAPRNDENIQRSTTKTSGRANLFTT